jgi:hypothetical protein
MNKKVWSDAMAAFIGINQSSLYLLIAIAAVILTVLIYWRKIFPRLRKTLGKMFMKKNIIRAGKITDYESFDDFLEFYGYYYDEEEDVFSTRLDSWQRDMGYCRLYDEAAAPFSMIIDCEPIYFNYKGKKWMIEFWKGQYGISTGCEVGVYVSDGIDLDTDFFSGEFFESVSDEYMLDISIAMIKNKKILFQKEGNHWWMTAFRLGEYSEPEELKVYLKITLLDRPMRDAFVEGLIEAGYRLEELNITGNEVELIYDRPRTEQPYSRNEIIDKIVQLNNSEMCERYNEITSGHETMLEKLMVLQDADPKLFGDVFSSGKPELLYNEFPKIMKYL